MRRSFSLLSRQGICLLLAASYIICLCAASLNAAPTVAEAGSIASLELLPRAENPHLSPDDPALAASIPETSGKNLQSWESLFPLLLVILWPTCSGPSASASETTGCRAIPTYAACSLSPPRRRLRILLFSLRIPSYFPVVSCSAARPASRSTP